MCISVERTLKLACTASTCISSRQKFYVGDVFYSNKNRRIDRTSCDDVSHASSRIRNLASEIPGDCSISSGLRVSVIHLLALQRKLNAHLPN